MKVKRWGCGAAFRRRMDLGRIERVCRFAVDSKLEMQGGRKKASFDRRHCTLGDMTANRSSDRGEDRAVIALPLLRRIGGVVG